MKYYKIIVDNTFIGVVSSGAFVEENPRTHRLHAATELNGQFVEWEGELYRDYWMRSVVTDHTFIQSLITEITEEEYNSIFAAIQNNEEIIIEDDEEEEIIPQPIPVEDPDVMLEFMRESKINEMSVACRHTIEAGFDLEIRGETHHFSLTTQDQLNLMNLSIIAQTQQLIPYHADGEAYEFYTADEINSIVAAATSFKNYNTAYFNALKSYINALETIGEISEITYGIPIPEEYKSEVLKVLE